MVNSFYDEQLEEGCAFEELISFHGGMGGPQTRPFLLHPAELEAPDEPVIGAEAAHRVLASWRACRARGAGASGPGAAGERTCRRREERAATPDTARRGSDTTEPVWLRSWARWASTRRRVGVEWLT